MWQKVCLPIECLDSQSPSSSLSEAWRSSRRRSVFSQWLMVNLFLCSSDAWLSSKETSQQHTAKVIGLKAGFQVKDSGPILVHIPEPAEKRRWIQKSCQFTCCAILRGSAVDLLKISSIFLSRGELLIASLWKANQRKACLTYRVGIESHFHGFIRDLWCIRNVSLILQLEQMQGEAF